MEKNVIRIVPARSMSSVPCTIVLWMVLTLPTMCQSSISVIKPDFPPITIAPPSLTHISAAKARATSVLNMDITALVPYGVVITNTAGVPITALDILYTCEMGGRSITRDFFYHASDLISPLEPLLLQSKVMFVTPHHEVNMGLIFSEPSSAPSPKAGIANTLSFLSKCEHIAVSLDMVVLSGGDVYGPDIAGTLKKFQDRLDGYRNFRALLLARLEGNETDSELLAWLGKEAHAPVTKKRGEHFIDQGVLERKQMAQEYLSAVQNGRRSEAITRLQNSPAENVFSQYLRLKRKIL